MSLVTSDFVIDAFGARWSLVTDGIDLAARDRLHVLWQACHVPSARAADEGVEPFVVSDPDPYAVSRAVTLASIRRRRGQAVMLHAAGLSDRGRAIALVGPSGTGKSTAARALGQHFGYLTDETFTIEGDDRVFPYPKPVSMITDPTQPWAKVEASPAELGLREATGTAYIHAVVVLERDPAHVTPELVPLPVVDAVLAVIKETSSQPLLDRPLERLAGLVCAAGGPYLLRYSEIGQCVDLLRALFEVGPGVEGEQWSSTPGTAPAPADPVGGMDAVGAALIQEAFPLADVVDGSTVVVRGPWRDAVHGESDSIVLIDHTPVRLGPIGEVLWELAVNPVSVADAHLAVVDAFGDHPDATALITQGVADMLRSGVLRLAG